MSDIDTSGCGCCQGIEVQTPAAIENPPGLTAIVYRVGTYAQFKASMQARLGASDLPGLRQLKTRGDDDFSLALLDSWAVVADVLTFYQERVANEAYKRTATERVSLLELARLVNYKLQPGVAADTYLAFTLETAIGSPTRTTIPLGTKVQSLPNPGEKPQTYETTETVEARAAWNVWKPGIQQVQTLTPDMKTVVLNGTNSNLRPGDPLLLMVKDTHDATLFIKVLRRVSSLSIDTPGQQTVHLEPLAAIPAATPAPTDAEGVYALRARASLFGYNAPDWRAMHESIQKHYDPDPNATEWPLDALQKAQDQLRLDRIYSQIIPGSWIVVEQSGSGGEITQVVAVIEATMANYALSAKISLLTISPVITPPQTFSELRQMTIYAQNERLTLAAMPDTRDVGGISVDIPGLSDVPASGRVVMVAGQTVGPASSQQVELATLGASTVVGNVTTLNFKAKLANTYKRDTLSIYGNIVRATQGESIRDEVLGSGDASQPYQHFTLRQSPLTYVQAATPDGKASTLSIAIDGIPWTEVDTLYGRGPHERIFVTHIEDDQSVSVEFGDGITGARLPTGADNVHASYRKGIGLQGVVQPGQLSILQNRPLGVKAVTNPLAPTGADDPETLDDARRNASNTIFTLGRVVSREDYAQFALSYARVAKAQATPVWTNTTRGVYVTIAGPLVAGDLASTQIVRDSALYTKISTGMRGASDPSVFFSLQQYRPVTFRLAASVTVSPDKAPDQVLSAITQAVVAQFSFEARSFGQAVSVNEVIAVIQTVPGVVIVRIDSFYDTSKPVSREDSIDAALPHVQADGTIALADLLMVSADQPFDSLEVLP